MRRLGFSIFIYALVIVCIYAFGLAAVQTAAALSFTGLGDLPGGSFYSIAYDVSSDGSVVVGNGTSASGREASRWTSSSGMVGLGDLPEGEVYSYAHRVSSDGSVVVGRSLSDDEAFIWDTTNGMRSLRTVLVDAGLDLTGWTLREARGVSADGLTIVGYGIGPSGGEAWVADLSTTTAEPIPEPTTIILMTCGLLGLLGICVKRRRKVK